MFFTQRRLRLLTKPIVFVVLTAFLIVSRFIPALSEFQDQFIHRTLTPVFSFFSNGWDRMEDFFGHYVFIIGAAQQNADLKAEISHLKERVRTLEDEKAAWGREKALFTSFDKIPEKTQLAHVVAYDPLKSSKTILIDEGSDKGIQKGQAVVVPEGAVGIVVKATSQDAQVMLLTDPKAAVDGEIRPSGARGLLHGEKRTLGLNRDYWLTKMEYLGVQQELHEQDVVVTSGLDQVFPLGIPIGKVQKILRDDKGLFLSAEVLPDVDFSKLKEVMVIVK